MVLLEILAGFILLLLITIVLLLLNGQKKELTVDDPTGEIKKRIADKLDAAIDQIKKIV